MHPCLTGSSKLTLDDLLAPLSSHSSNLNNLKKSTKALAPTASGKNKPLAAPLPQRTQEKLDREAAYEQTKAETDKWNDTMKRIREVRSIFFLVAIDPTFHNFLLGRTFELSLAT